MVETMIGSSIGLLLALLAGAFGYGRLTGRVVSLERVVMDMRSSMAAAAAQIRTLELQHAEFLSGQKAVMQKLDNISELIDHGQRQHRT